MDVLQHINKLFCPLFVFFIGTKSYSQREIHPLEPMFTYDNALKYYSNLPLTDKFSFTFLENFQMPIGTESVEIDYLTTDFSYHNLHGYLGGKRLVCYYDSETGYITKSYTVRADKKNNSLTDTISENIYSYIIDSLNTAIKIAKIDNLSSIDGEYQYIFENKTGNLQEIQYENCFDEKYEYRFVYDEIKKYVSQVILNSYYQNKVKDTHIYEIVNISDFKVEKSDFIFFNDKKVFLNRDRSTIDIVSKEQKSYTDNIVQFSKNHISFHWKHNNHPKERTGLLLFNDKKDLAGIRYSNTDYGPLFAYIGKKNRLIHRRYSVFEKKNDEKWVSYTYISYPRKYGKGHTKYRKDPWYKTDRYILTDNIIYRNDIPFIIYNLKK